MKKYMRRFDDFKHDGMTMDMVDLKAIKEAGGIIFLDEDERFLIWLLPMLPFTYTVDWMADKHDSIGSVLKFVKFVNKSLQDVKENYDIIKLVGMTPEYNKPALKMAEHMGFKQEGKITKCFIKNNMIYDIIITGLNLEVK